HCIVGPLPRSSCSKSFADRGCDLCLNVFDDANALSSHRETCLFSAPSPLATKMSSRDALMSGSGSVRGKCAGVKAVAIDCEMVGGGDDGTIDLCGQVCLVDEDENIVFHAYVQPQVPVTDYRSEVTGLTEEHLKDGMPLKQVQDRILEILYNGESVEKAKSDGGKARLLVGHSLEYDLECLRISYPPKLLRDTAKYRPLMKTNLVSYSLKYLTQTYLGYEIQKGEHDPYEDCLSVMRLYKRIRSFDDHHHRLEVGQCKGNQKTSDGYDSWKLSELEAMSPDELYEISTSNYRCWCLDFGQQQ
ncbi:RNA exonuclease 4, partial [Linum perenne]